MVAGKIVATFLTIYVYALRLMLFDLHALIKSYIALDDDTRPYAPSAIIYSIFSMLYICQKKRTAICFSRKPSVKKLLCATIIEQWMTYPRFNRRLLATFIDYVTLPST